MVNKLPEAPIPSSNQFPASDKAKDSALPDQALSLAITTRHTYTHTKGFG